MTPARPWLFVEHDELVTMHAHAVARYGGEPSPPQAGCLERSIGAAISAALYSTDSQDPDLLVAVSYLLVYLAKNHCFVDGNKRVAWMAFLRALDLNGLAVDADELDAAALVNDVATGAVDAIGVARWLTEPGRLIAAPFPN